MPSAGLTLVWGQGLTVSVHCRVHLGIISSAFSWLEVFELAEQGQDVKAYAGLVWMMS